MLYNGGHVWNPSTMVRSISTPSITPEAAEGLLYHFAAVKNKTHMTFFLNGELAGRAALDPVADFVNFNSALVTPWILGGRMVLVGGQWLTNDRNFGGILDEVRWWSVARTVSELQEFMRKPVGENIAGLVAQWHFDAGRGEGSIDKFVLGGGNPSTSPAWVPSPFPGHGGPVALATRVGAAQQSLKVCALLTPAVPGATAVVALQSNSTALGDLRITNQAMVAQLDGVPSGSQRFCTNATFVPSSAGFGEFPFAVTAVLPLGETLIANQSIAISVVRNLPPVAGAARAVKTNGVDSYLSLGSWGVAEEWSMSLWLQPHVLADDVYMVTQHLSKGSNAFMLGFLQSSYWVRISCYIGCSTSATVALGFPAETGSAAVLSTGLTGDEVRLRMREPHHLAVTFRCLSRGGNGTGPVGHLKVYQDGKLIGNKPDFRSCMTLPLVPEAYHEDDWQNRPTPWEMGEEYDAGPLGGHLPGVAVVPSNFMDATFDEFVVWNVSLSDAEILAVSQGHLPRTNDLNVRYSFDQDDKAECRERQLWDATATCFGINEAFGRTQPSKIFPWTNSAIGDVQRVPSPFGKVPGAWIHKALSAGTCVNATLLGSDADADPLKFWLVEVPRGAAVRLTGNQLELCDGNPASTSTREVSVTFDVCDPYSSCASNVTGLGRVIFHILPVGPAVVAFQGLRDDMDLRLVFNTPTNCPFVGTLGALNVTLRLSDSTAALLGAYWETGCRALRLILADPVKWFNAHPAAVRAQLLDGGFVRDAFESTFPSRGTSPLLTDVSCAAGELLLPGEVFCRPCPQGSIPMLNKTSSTKECTPCAAGSAGETECSECPAGRFASDLGLTQCKLCPRGHFCSGQGSTIATACPLGTFGSASGQTACALCPVASFGDADAQTSCKECAPASSSAPELWTTLKQVSGTAQLVPFEGATAFESCGCRPGSRPEKGDCVPCGVGLTCAGMGQVHVLPGYHALPDRPGEVWECFGEDGQLRCPGGPLSTCAPGRVNSSVACSLCEPGLAPAKSGRCEPCGGADCALPIVLCIIALILVVAMYLSVEFRSKATEKEIFLCVFTITSQLLSTFQQLAVWSHLAISWPPAFRSILKVFSVLELDMDHLRLGCIWDVSPGVKFAMRILIVFALFIVVVIVHVIVSRFRHGQLQGRKASLLGACGTLFMTFTVSIVSMLVAPLQCQVHPSGFSTMKGDNSVICWPGSFGGSDHSSMVIISLCSCTLPVCFVAGASWATWKLPATIRAGDLEFLRMSDFFFARFRSGCYVYPLVYLMRNMIVAVTPALPRVDLQILLLVSVFMLGYGLASRWLPWRSPAGNIIDIFGGAFMMCLLNLASSLSQGTDPTSLGNIFIALFACVMILFIVSIAKVLVGKLLQRGKRYKVFLCHSKSQSGNLARLLKIRLVAGGLPADSVFIDSDNLRDLNGLFATVRERVANLVALCAKGLLLRPWCLGEIATATLNHIHIIRVIMQDYSPPPPEVLDQVLSLAGMQILTEAGMSRCMIASTVQFFDSTVSLMFEPSVSMRHVDAIAKGLYSASVDASTSGIARRPSGVAGSTCVVMSTQHTEAQCAAYILREVLKGLLAAQAEKFPFVLQAGGHISQMAKVVLLVCTNDLYESADAIRAMLTAADLKLAVLPVVMEKTFRFPTALFMQKLCKDAETLISQFIGRRDAWTGQYLTSYVESIFTAIAPEVDPQGSIVLITAQITEISNRIIRDDLSIPTAQVAAATRADSAVATVTAPSPLLVEEEGQGTGHRDSYRGGFSD